MEPSTPALASNEVLSFQAQQEVWRLWRAEALRQFKLSIRAATHTADDIGGVVFLWYIWQPFNLAFFYGNIDEKPSPSSDVKEYSLLTIIRDSESNRLSYVNLDSGVSYEAALGLIFALRASGLITTPYTIEQQEMQTLDQINIATLIYDISTETVLTPVETPIIVPNTEDFAVYTVDDLIDLYYGGTVPTYVPEL